MLFIDAAKAQYIKFFEKYKENLVDDGFVVSDNIDFLTNNEEFDTKFYKVGDGIAITYRKEVKSE